MALVNGTLSDFGLDPLTVNTPRLIFRASSTGIAGLNILSAKKAVEVTPAANGFFEVDLVPTAAVAPADSHYTIEIQYRENETRRKVSEVLPWKLYVTSDGGSLGDLLRVPANPGMVWNGTEPPAIPSPGTWWLDPETADLAEFDGDGWTHKANLRGPAGLNATDAAGDDAAIAAFIQGAGTATGDALAEKVIEQTGPRFAAKRVHLILAAGQSNMSGRGAGYSALTDPAHPRILQYGSKVRTLRAAAEPLDMHDAATGIGPAFQFARRYLQTLPQDDLVVIVPAAHGGTALSTNTTPLGWRWGVAGNLSAQAVTQTQEAVAAAQAAYPGATVTIDAVLWIQGETDSTTGNMTPGATYQADLDALIAGFRAAFADDTLPFIIGQMLPEAMGTGTRDAIDDVQQNTPYRVAHTGFSFSAPAGNSNGDLLHFNAAGQRINAKNMFDEFQRVRTGLAPVNPDRVLPPAHSPGATVWADTFTRADAETLGATSTGALPWVEIKSGTFGTHGGIRSNEYAPIYEAVNGGTIIDYIDTGFADGYLQATISATNQYMRLAFRIVDAANYLIVYATGTEVSLRKYAAGVSSTIATATLTSATSRDIEVFMLDDQISVYVAGALVIGPTTVADYKTSDLHGVQLAGVAGVATGRIADMKFRQVVTA